MEYDKNNLIKDFFERTLYNLDLYKAEKINTPEKYKNEITLTINSLLGLLVFIKEKKSIDYEDMQLTEIIDKSQYANDKNKKTKKDFFRHMRNSIAHGRCLEGFEIDNNKQIKSLKFLDFNSESKTFEVVLTIDDINLIINELKSKVLGASSET